VRSAEIEERFAPLREAIGDPQAVSPFFRISGLLRHSTNRPQPMEVTMEDAALSPARIPLPFLRLWQEDLATMEGQVSFVSIRKWLRVRYLSSREAHWASNRFRQSVRHEYGPLVRE
jgi:hypothetical protein